MLIHVITPSTTEQHHCLHWNHLHIQSVLSSQLFVVGRRRRAQQLLSFGIDHMSDVFAFVYATELLLACP